MMVMARSRMKVTVMSHLLMMPVVTMKERGLLHPNLHMCLVVKMRMGSEGQVRCVREDKERAHRKGTDAIEIEVREMCG